MAPLRTRFESKYEPVTETGCWLWLGGVVSPLGHGTLRNEEQRHELAHRISYRLNVGPIPDGMQVLHRCDVGGCVNPTHLFLGTQGDNMRDMVAKGRENRSRNVKGESHPLAKLKESQVREIRASDEASVVLAKRYGVSRTQITAVRLGRSWKSIH